MTKAQYDAELESTMKLEKIYGKDSNLIKNRLEWLATVDIEDDVEDVDDLDFETLYKETYKIVEENTDKLTAKEIALGAVGTVLGVAEGLLTLVGIFAPFIYLFIYLNLFKLIF